jgi:hypothetical protein
MIGGYFQQIIPAGAPLGSDASATVAASWRQRSFIIAVYAFNPERRNPFIYRRSPLARFRITSPLQKGDFKDRVQISFATTPDGFLHLAARDQVTKKPLDLALVSAKDALAYHAPHPSQSSLLPIAENTSDKPLSRNIGIRSAGGLFTVLLPQGEQAAATSGAMAPTRRFIAATPDQTTALLTLYTGHSPYIEHCKPIESWSISGITPGPTRPRFDVTFRLTPAGRPTLTATQPIGAHSHPLTTTLIDTADYIPPANLSLPDHAPQPHPSLTGAIPPIPPGFAQ